MFGTSRLSDLSVDARAHLRAAARITLGWLDGLKEKRPAPRRGAAPEDMLKKDLFSVLRKLGWARRVATLPAGEHALYTRLVDAVLRVSQVLVEDDLAREFRRLKDSTPAVSFVLRRDRHLALADPQVLRDTMDVLVGCLVADRISELRELAS